MSTFVLIISRFVASLLSAAIAAIWLSCAEYIICPALLFHASEVSKKLLSDYEVVILYHNINYNKCYFHIDKSVNISFNDLPASIVSS